MYSAKNVAGICLFLILGSVFSDCVVFYGDISLLAGLYMHTTCIKLTGLRELPPSHYKFTGWLVHAHHMHQADRVKGITHITQ